jgi:serine/threonine-protein kinase
MAPRDSFPRPFGRYTLLGNLAQGGMGALYLACTGEAGMEKLCVIKTVLPQLADKEYVARFRDEAKVVVKLSHGNLVPVFDANMASSESGEEMYLAMEHVDGKDLRAVWNRCAKRGIAFPVDVAVYIAKELSRGLHHAHTFAAIKLVHRDVSPPNVLLSFFGEVKLTDFGLAASTLKAEKTAPGVIYGKVSYMSPEQARGEALDGRTDLYSVGIILWELLTGRQLFAQATPNLIERVRDPVIESPSTYAQRVPPSLDAIVMKALARDRTLRFADCEAFRAALAGFLAQTAPTTDNARVIAFLQQLFGDEIDDERQARQQLLDNLAASRTRALISGESGPQTVTLHPKDPPASGIIGTYLDGRYLVKGLIGEGGMGMVYEAEHVEIGRRVAVKVLHERFSRQAEVVARFRSEARAATRIGHPHIIDVFDSGTTVDGAVYFVMEYLQGRDLAHLIDTEGALPLDRALAITRQICQALAAAHRAGILHRDIKPENVFLVPRDGYPDFVKVLDFGIAKTVDSKRIGRLTSPGMAMGTPEYMAPEQAAGQSIDARADVYAVGAILYEMLSGKPPHDGQNVLEILTRKATQAPTSLTRLRPDVPRELERLIMRTLAVSTAHRPQSMESLQRELSAIIPGGSVAAPPSVEQAAVGTDRLPRRRGGYMIAGAAAASLVVVVTALVVQRLAVTASESRAVESARASAPAAVGGVAAAPGRAPTLTAPAPSTAPAAATASAASDAELRSRPTAPSAAKPIVAPTRVITVERPVVLHSPNATKSSAPASPAGMSLTEARRLLKEARDAQLAGRFSQSEELYNRVRNAGQERAAASTGLAEVAFQRGNFPDSVRLGQHAVESGGGVPAKLVLGNSYFKLGKYDDAIAQYRAVLAIDPNNTEASAFLAAAQKRKAK